MRGSRVIAPPNARAIARQETAGPRRGTPRLDSSRTAQRRGQRRLLGRFGNHGVAGRERGGDLAREDRQREIPRADAREHAAPVQRAARCARRWARATALRAEVRARLRRVVTQEVDRLAHFGQRHRAGLAGFAHAERDELGRGCSSKRSAARSQHRARALPAPASQAGCAPCAHRCRASTRRPQSRCTRADTSRRSAGLRTAASRRCRACPSIDRLRAPASRTRASHARPCVATPRRPRGSHPASSPFRREKMSRRRDARMRARRSSASTCATGSATISLDRLARR